MWPSLVKIQYTELKLSCGNDPVVKNYIHSNGDLDLWPNDPKINRVLPLPQGNHVTKIGKDPIYRTKVIVRKPVWTPALPPPASHAQSHNTVPSRDGRKKSEYFLEIWDNAISLPEDCRDREIIFESEDMIRQSLTKRTLIDIFSPM